MPVVDLYSPLPELEPGALAGFLADLISNHPTVDWATVLSLLRGSIYVDGPGGKTLIAILRDRSTLIHMNDESIVYLSPAAAKHDAALLGVDLHII